MPAPSSVLVFPLTYPLSASNSQSTVGNQTIPAAQLLTGVGSEMVYVRSGMTGATTDTTDTATNIIAQMSNPQLNALFKFIVLNTNGTAQTLTIAGGSGVTVNPLGGTATVAQNTSKVFLGTVTNPTTPTVSLQSYLSGSF